jgi:hypothetical protein
MTVETTGGYSQSPGRTRASQKLNVARGDLLGRLNGAGAEKNNAENY